MSTREERRKWYWYIAAVVPTAVIVVHMLYTVWTSGGYGLVRAAVNQLPVVPQDAAGVEAVAVFGLGVYLTWLGLFTNDYRKRYQGYLLSLVTAVVLGALWYVGVFIPNIDPTLWNLGAFVLGVVVALLSEGAAFQKPLTDDDEPIEGDLPNLDFEESSLGAAKTGAQEWAEFPIASRGVLWCIGGVVIGGLVLGVVQLFIGLLPVGPGVAWNPLYLGIWGIGAYLFLRVVDAFIELEAEIDRYDIEVLGPTASGKTVTAYALSSTAQEISGDGVSLDESQGVRDLWETHTNWEGDGWPFDSTYVTDYPLISFRTLVGDRFPKQIGIEMADHAGEHLAEVAKRLTPEQSAINSEKVMTDGGSTDEEEENNPENPEESEDTATTNSSIVDIDEEASDPDDSSADEPTAPDSVEESETDGPGMDGAFNRSQDSAEADGRYRAVEDETEEVEGEGSSRDFETPADTNSGHPPDEDTDDGRSVTGPTARMGSASEINEELDEDEAGPDGESVSAEPEVDADSDDADTSDAESEERAEEGADKDDEESNTEEIINDLTRRVRNADRLVLLIDCERMQGNDPTEGPYDATARSPRLREYLQILDAADIDQTVPVATKADLYLEEWRDEQDRKPADPGESEAALDEFTDYLTQKFKEGPQKDLITALLANGNSSTIYPAYCKTTVDKTDEDEEIRVPETGDANNLIPVGYERVLNAIGR